MIIAAVEAEPDGRLVPAWWDYTNAYNEMISATDTRRAVVDLGPTTKRAYVLASGQFLRARAFEEPKLGKRQKRPDNFVDDTTARNVVPDVF